MQTLDKFYTNEEEAKRFIGITIDTIGRSDWEWCEPSAGGGSFYTNLPCPKIGYDISPECEGVMEQDFLDVDLDYSEKRVFIGNPPFGRCSSMALKFLNKCGNHGKWTAFILPKTFSKIFYQNKINKYLHLVKEEGLLNNLFLCNNGYIEVPCVFQIWERREYRRKLVKSCPDKYWEVVNPNKADYAIRRAGGNAGRVITEGVSGLTVSSTYFVKEKLPVMGYVNSLYPKIKEEASKTAGVRSITLKEIAYFLDKEG